MMAGSVKEIVRPFYLKWFYFLIRPAAKPQAWRDCWKYPESWPADHSLAVAALSDVLFLPMTDWHARIQRPHHLARELAALGHRVFYLNMHLGREFPHPVAVSRRTRVCQLGQRLWEVHSGLVREPVYHHRQLRPGEIRQVITALDRIFRAAGTRRLAIVSQFPLWNQVAVELRSRYGGPLIYDCHDLLSGFSRIAGEIISAENELYLQADTVVFSAKSLLDKAAGEVASLENKARLIRNGVAVSHFRFGAGGRGKVAGYVGSLDEWFDVEAVACAARRLPEVKFVFLGRIEDRRVMDLAKLPNVRLYGEIPYDRLPQYMSEFDVGLIPFLVSPLTLATNPIKLYEYFSCGLPVVSARLPEVELYQDLVYLAGSPEDFALQVERALAERDPRLRQARRRAAEQESWTERASSLARVIAAAKR
jgi:hypothetical protein